MNKNFNNYIVSKLSEKYNINTKLISSKIKIPTLNSSNINEVNKLILGDRVYYINDNSIYEDFNIINKNLHIGKQIGYIKGKNIYINKFD